MLKHVNEENFESEVLNSKTPILVDFFATWCGPCRMLEQEKKKISNSRAGFDIAKIDIDGARDLALKYGIEVVPTMIIFKDGKPLNRMEGFMNENEIVSEMSKYIDE